MTIDQTNNVRLQLALRQKAVDTQVGLKIGRAREAKGLSVAQLADLIALSRVDVTEYEAGVRRPSAAVLVQLASHLNVPLGHFFDFDLPEQVVAGDGCTSAGRGHPK